MVDKTLIKVKKLSNKKIKNEKSLKEILAYGGVSLWWFIEHSVYLKMKGTENRRVTNKKFLIGLICIFMKIFIMAKSLFRSIFGHLLEKKSGNPSNRKIIASNSLFKWGEIIGTVTLKARKEDTMLGTIIDALERENFSILGLDRDDGHLIDVRRFFDKLIYGREIWRPIETYLTWSIIRNVFRSSKELEKKWEGFLRCLEDENKKLFDTLSGDFKIFFVYHIFQAMLYMELVKRVIDTEKPKLMIVACEHSDSGRAMIVLGKLNGVPTLAVQHGFFPSHVVTYFHESKEISNKISPQYIQLPDKTLVFGPWFKRTLTQISNYPTESVVVTGQPKYDILTNPDEVFSREKFCKKYNLNPNKRTALLITQPFDTIKERDIFLRNLLRVLNKFRNIEIVIKPHPRESESWHKKIVKEEGIDTTVLPRDSNIYEALHACDVMMTVSSTTVIEATILGKPVVIVNLAGNPDPIHYVKAGVALGVHRKEDLTRTMKGALYDKETREKLKKARNKFVYQHAYKQDGKATERVINLIKEMIEEKEYV